MLRRGFYAIIAPQFRLTGAPPPPYFLGELMDFLSQKYYIGLLSAAELHGAAHFKPQTYQIVTDKATRKISLPRMNVRFYKSKNTSAVSTQQMKFFSGYLSVSTPETTAFDLLYYQEAGGGLNAAVSVIAGLAQKLEPARIRGLLDIGLQLAPIQRLGYVLDKLEMQDLSRILGYEIRNRKPLYAPLQPDNKLTGCNRNQKWRIIENAAIEVEP